MCELLGLSFNQPVEMDISFSILRARGRRNPDGWGMAWFGADDQLRLVKEPVAAHQSELAGNLPYYATIKSKIFISHIRKASTGTVNYVNTHPFYRQVNRQTWVLAHNGTVKGLGDSKNTGFIPIGDTDSERLFCHLLGWIKEQTTTSGRAFNEALATKLRELNRHGSTNLLFTNGKRLYAYHDANGYKGLYCLRRQAPFPTTTLSDTDIKLNLGDIKHPSEYGWIVATRPLTNEPWTAMNPGELMVFYEGKRVFRSTTFTTHDGAAAEIALLRVLRTSPHKLSLRQLAMELKQKPNRILITLSALFKKGLITRDARDTVPADHPDATFYTLPSRRAEIDAIIAGQRIDPIY